MANPFRDSSADFRSLITSDERGGGGGGEGDGSVVRAL